LSVLDKHHVGAISDQRCFLVFILGGVQIFTICSFHKFIVLTSDIHKSSLVVPVW